MREANPPARGVVTGLLVGAAGALALALAPGYLTGPKGLVLTLPVVAAAVLRGRRAAFATAAVATIVFWFFVVPPIGSFRVNISADRTELITFALVAALVGEVVARGSDMVRVDAQRTAMLRSVSHDLRTPLSTIKAAASELVHEDTYDAAARRRMLELVNKEADRLDRLVANLLDMSRIEAGAFQARPQSLDLGEVCRACTARLRAMFGTVAVELDVPESLTPISADFVLVDQLLSNLLENAARHSPVDGTVRVAVREDERAVVLTVSDEGAGVAREDRRDIFKPFMSSRGGSGIGLAICKAVVDAHGGTISVRDRIGGGAEFVVTLPRR
jgi:K+-sensing histidine kinase KdpD